MQLYVASTQYSVQISVFLCYYTGLVSDYEKGILFIAKSQKKKRSVSVSLNVLELGLDLFLKLNY